MATWVRAICRRALGEVSAEGLRSAIERRIELVTYLYGEDDPEEIIASLRIEDLAPRSRLATFRIGWGEDDERSILGERWWQPDRVREEAGELLERLSNRQEEAAQRLSAWLADAVEIVGIELRPDDLESQAWPLAIAAAAYFAAQGNGIVYAEGDGWLEPAPHDVTCILDDTSIQRREIVDANH